VRVRECASKCAPSDVLQSRGRLAPCRPRVCKARALPPPHAGCIARGAARCVSGGARLERFLGADLRRVFLFCVALIYTVESGRPLRSLKPPHYPSPPLGFYPTPTRFLRPAFASALLVLRRTRQITRSTERRPGALAPGVPANAPRPTVRARLRSVLVK